MGIRHIWEGEVVQLTVQTGGLSSESRIARVQPR